jgi:hypothetical protein
MPFDGFCPPDNSPLARLLEADRKLTIARRAAQARESILVLNMLETLFANGKNWVQNMYDDGAGHYCLAGGLRHIRRFREPEDQARVYLSWAIANTFGKRQAIINFNDGTDGSRRSYSDIRLVIHRARELARQDADWQAGGHDAA